MSKKVAVVTLAVLLFMGIVLPWSKILPNSLSQKIFNSEALAKKKKTKKNYKRVYNFTLTGDCSNADYIVNEDLSDANEYTYLRKFSVPEFKSSNMPKYELLKKVNYTGLTDESWEAIKPDVVSDGYILLPYAMKDNDGDCETILNAGGRYRLFIYN